jgi:hypothetical protein
MSEEEVKEERKSYPVQLEDIGALDLGFNETEAKAAQAFIDSHHVADRDSLGFVRWQFAFSVTPTTVGRLFSVQDKVSSDELAFTDIDKF